VLFTKLYSYKIPSQKSIILQGKKKAQLFPLKTTEKLW